MPECIASIIKPAPETWEEALEPLDGLAGAALAVVLLAVRLGLAQLRVHLLQLLAQVVPLRPAQCEPFRMRSILLAGMFPIICQSALA